MKRFGRASIVLFSWLALHGCVSGAPWADPSLAQATEDRVPADVAAVWQVLPQVLSRLGLESSVEATGESPVIVATRRVEVSRGRVGPGDAPWARCAVSGTTDGDDDLLDLALQRAHGFATLELRTVFVSVDGGTLLRPEMTVSGSVGAADVLGDGALCVTTGRVEALVVEGVRGLLAPPDSVPDSRPGEDSPFRR